MDNSTGAVCFAAQADNSAGKGPKDFFKGYLQWITSATWSAPAPSASLQPSANELSGGKYAITYTPNAATARIYDEGYYASVAWYQPKYASSYTGVARYGKNDYVGAYCMQGHTSTTYFSPFSGAVKLANAFNLAVSVITASTAIALAI